MRLKLQFILAFCICKFSIGYAQHMLTGIITDEKKEPLAGVSIFVSSAIGTTSNASGSYQLKLNEAGTYEISFSYVGYETEKRKVFISGETRMNLQLKPNHGELNQVVVSAGRFEQEIKRVSVSTDIIKPYLIENKVVVNMEHIMNQLPSVNVIDGQVNIRSGSGWSYGAGSRVMVLLDDMPYLSGDAGQVQWKFIPTENIEQMEVIKGASSVLYGSSALNGTIHIRTATPKDKPQSGFALFSGFFDQPDRDSARWSKRTRWQYGFNAYHNRKIKQLDLSTSINYLKDEGYRLGENDERLRINWRTNYRNKKIAGLSYGLNGSVNTQKSASFLLWESYPQSYISLDSASTDARVLNVSIDPHLDFYTGSLKHKVRGRMMHTNNDITNIQGDSNNQDNSFNLWYGEYQSQLPFFKNKFMFSAGLAGSYTYSNSPLYNGTNTAANYAPFAQLDYRYKRISFSAGMRHEQFAINEFKQSQTIKRAGLNIEASRYTFLRISYGEGFRFPSIAERYVTTSVGILNVFSNPALKPESGWNGEVGIKQGFKMGNWQGYADIAYFHTEYDNMIEFIFGQWKEPDINNPLASLGFKSLNIGKTRITGWDITLAGQGRLTDSWELKVLAGYTYNNPVAVDFDKIIATSFDGSVAFPYKFYNEDSTNNTLKYRYNHLAKADVELEYKKISIGVSIRYNSYMQNIDRIFLEPLLEQAVPGIRRGRQLNPDGDWITDIRIAYKLNTNWHFNLVVNNITNHEQMTRPADMRPPRMFVVQTSYKW
jgi:outer membrane cobalamin receptor